MVNPNLDLKSRNSQWICHFQRGVPWFWSTYIHTHDRLDKPRSALADAQLKNMSRILQIIQNWWMYDQFWCFTESLLKLIRYLCHIIYFSTIPWPINVHIINGSPWQSTVAEYLVSKGNPIWLIQDHPFNFSWRHQIFRILV